MTTAAKLLKKSGKTKVKETLKEDTVAKKTTTKKTTTKKTTAKADFDLIVKTSQEMEKLTKVKALELARKLVDEVDFNYFRLGGVMSAIQANDFWKGAQDSNGEVYDTFKSFMGGEYGMNYRKGMYLIGIYNSLVEAEVEWDKVKDVGWTKLKELHAVLTKENVDEWVEKAMGMTTIQLIDYIKNLGSADPKSNKNKDDKSLKLTTITFKVHEDQKETIQSALDKAMTENKTDATSVALDYICMNFLEAKAGKKKIVKQKTLLQLLKAGEEQEVFDVIGKAFPQYDISVDDAVSSEKDDTEM